MPRAAYRRRYTRRAPARKGGRARRLYKRRPGKAVTQRQFNAYRHPKVIGTRIPGYPRQRVVHLRYSSGHRQLDMNVGANYKYSFSCNDLNKIDPTQAAWPSQNRPSIMQLWAGLYNHWVVVKAVITATFMFPGLVAVPEGSQYPQSPMTCFVRIDDDDTITDFNAQNIKEGGKVFWKTIMPGSNSKQFKLRGVYTPRSFFGRVDAEDDDELRGSNNKLIGDNAYWHVGIANDLGTASGQGGVFVNATIDYYVKFMEPNDQANNPYDT